MKLFVAIAFVALIGGSLVDARAVRDVKSDLIARGQALLTRADAAVRELEHVHNVHEAAIIRSEETRIRTLIAELELATATTSVVHLEAELTRAEDQLARELERIHRVVVDPIHVPHEPVVHLPGKRDTKSDLIARGNALLARATAAIVTHEARHNTHEVAIIRSEEAKIRSLIAELELATATTSIVHLEHQLSAAEQQLTYELEKINHLVVVDPIVHVPHTDPIIHHEPVVHHPGKRDTKSDLIARGNALLARATSAIVTHEARHNTHEVAVLRSEEAKILNLISQLEFATATTSIVHLEHELSAAEQQLTYELEKLNHLVVVDPVIHHEPVVHLPGKRDTKSDLIARGTALLARADAAIRSHEARHNTHEVTVLRSQEAKIRSLITELELATATTSIVHLEHELSTAEQQLTYELERLNHLLVDPIVHIPHEPVVHLPGKRDTKSDLIARGTALLARADAAIRSHEARHNTHEVTVLRSQEAKIRSLITELELATATTSIVHLEHELSTAEQQLTYELERLNHLLVDPIVHIPHEPIVHLPGKRDTKSDLIARGNALLARATSAIVTHEARHNTHEVAVLRSEEAKIRSLISQLELATATTSIVHLEHELSAAEQQLTYELEKLNHLVVDPIVHVPHVPVVHHGI